MCVGEMSVRRGGIVPGINLHGNSAAFFCCRCGYFTQLHPKITINQRNRNIKHQYCTRLLNAHKYGAQACAYPIHTTARYRLHHRAKSLTVDLAGTLLVGVRVFLAFVNAYTGQRGQRERFTIVLD